ncbi:MAG: response regulator transcription factor [Actinomycetes bacterium]
MTTVLLVDDHSLLRSGLATLIESTGDLHVVGQAADGEQALAVALECTPDVILMDLSMPIVDGVEATRNVLAALPDTKVVVLTSFSDRAQVERALQAGAIGYVLKDADPQDLVAAVRSAAAGHAPIDPRVARALLPSAKVSSPTDQLSAREIEVLRLIGKGMANKQIGRALGIQENTVKAHVGSIFRAIGVTDRTSAALWARENLPDD